MFDIAVVSVGVVVFVSAFIHTLTEETIPQIKEDIEEYKRSKNKEKEEGDEVSKIKEDLGI